MRWTYYGLLAVAALAALAPTLQAQTYPSGQPYLGPYSVYNEKLTALKPAFVVPVPNVTSIRIQTTVNVPDRGTVLLGGYSRLSEARNEFGTPGLGKVPYVGRGFGNVGYGREAVAGRVTATVRIIDLAEEEERQTGVRSRR